MDLIRSDVPISGLKQQRIILLLITNEQLLLLDRLWGTREYAPYWNSLVEKYHHMLEPSTKLNALVAEHVFGWTHDAESRLSRGWYDADGRQADLKDWSGSWEYAGPILEQLPLLGSVMKLETPFWGCSADAEIIKGKTGPHAICLAALYLKGVKGVDYHKASVPA